DSTHVSTSHCRTCSDRVSQSCEYRFAPGATLHRRHYSAGIGRTRRVCACALFALPVSFPRPAAEGTESGEYPLRYGPSDLQRVCKTPSCIRPIDRVGHIPAALCLL